MNLVNVLVADAKFSMVEVTTSAFIGEFGQHRTYRPIGVSRRKPSQRGTARNRASSHNIRAITTR